MPKSTPDVMGKEAREMDPGSGADPEDEWQRECDIDLTSDPHASISRCNSCWSLGITPEQKIQEDAASVAPSKKNMWVRFLRSKFADRLITGHNVFGLCMLFLWLVPYNYIAKEKILRYLVRLDPNRKFMSFVNPIGALMLYIAYREAKRLENRYSMLPTAPNATMSVARVRILLDGALRLAKASASVVLTLFIRRAWYLMSGKDGVDNLIALEMGKIEQEIVDWKPPSFSTLSTFTAPFRRVLDPVFLGLEHVPKERPLMFVSNHTLMAFDLPCLLWGLRKHLDISLRPLADHSHFQIPGSADVLRSVLGAVDGTRRNVEILAKAKQCIFVYPGGAREVFKTANDRKYELIWGDRLGFAAMAIKHGCTIIPVINYGTEDWVDVVGSVPMGYLPIPFLWGSDRQFPVMAPKVGKLQRMYFLFGDPIATSHLQGKEEEKDVAWGVREKTKQAIEQGIEILRQISRDDPQRRGLVNSVSHFGVKDLVGWIRNPTATKRNSSNSKAKLEDVMSDAAQAVDSSMKGSRKAVLDPVSMTKTRKQARKSSQKHRTASKREPDSKTRSRISAISRQLDQLDLGRASRSRASSNPRENSAS